MMNASEKPSITGILRPLHGKSSSAVESTADGYLRYFDRESSRPAAADDGEDSDVEAVERRRKDALAVTNAYYDLATDFYEYGWGDAFHFAVLKPEESREHSFAKHEYFLAMKLGLKAGDNCLVCKTLYIIIIIIIIIIPGRCLWCCHRDLQSLREFTWFI